MKDFKSFLIGFLMCACMFLFMGNTKHGESTSSYYFGHYQAFSTADKIYMIDTTTGQLYGVGSPRMSDWKKMKATIK